MHVTHFGRGIMVAVGAWHYKYRPLIPISVRQGLSCFMWKSRPVRATSSAGVILPRVLSIWFLQLISRSSHSAFLGFAWDAIQSHPNKTPVPASKELWWLSNTVKRTTPSLLAIRQVLNMEVVPWKTELHKAGEMGTCEADLHILLI